MKPLHAKWIMDLYNELTSEKGKEIVLSGWRASGILDAVEIIIIMKKKCKQE